MNRNFNPLRRADDPRHGTSGGYYGHGCRCDKCRKFARDSSRERRAERKLAIQPEDHGKATTYINASCRCEPCKEAATLQRNSQTKNRYKGTKVALSDLA